MLYDTGEGRVWDVGVEQVIGLGRGGAVVGRKARGQKGNWKQDNRIEEEKREEWGEGKRGEQKQGEKGEVGERNHEEEEEEEVMHDKLRTQTFSYNFRGQWRQLENFVS